MEQCWLNFVFMRGEGGKREITDHRHVLETHKRQDKAKTETRLTETR